MVTDKSSNAVWQWNQTEPFGNTVPNQDSNNTGNQFVFNLRFAGQYADIETGLFYNYFRDYDPVTGRYIESDPIRLKARQFSTFAYVGGNPLKYKDPLGLIKLNLIDPDSPAYAQFEAVPDDPNTVNIGADGGYDWLGNYKSLLWPNGTPLSPKDLADLIAGLPGFKDVMV